MAETLVVVKPTIGSLTVNVDLSPDLTGGELVQSVAAITAPVSSPLLQSVVVPNGTSTGLLVTLTDGAEGVTYGIKIEATTSLNRVIPVLLAVDCHTDAHVPYTTTNPYTYQSLLDEIEAGDSAIAKSVFILPSDSAASSTNTQVIWQLMDYHGTVYASGNAFNYQFTQDTFHFIVEAQAVVNVPSEVPPSLDTERYQLRWELSSLNGSFATQYQSENIRVVGLTTVPTGAQDVVELVGDPAQVSLVINDIATDVAYEVFKGNNRLTTSPIPVTIKHRTSAGWYYEALIETGSNELTGSLDPYAVSWRYHNKSTPWAVQRETSRLFVVTPSILTAIEDVRAMVNRAQTTLFRFPDTLFENTTILSHLRTGRDDFNAAAGVLTLFDMTNATGGIRSFWLMYSYVSILRSQYIAEGEKAFNFNGQAISLDVDRTQYYQGLAQDILSQVSNDVKPFKTNLVKKGVSGGDGDQSKVPATGNVGALGIAVTPASQFARAWPLWGSH